MLPRDGGWFGKMPKVSNLEKGTFQANVDRERERERIKETYVQGWVRIDV